MAGRHDGTAVPPPNATCADRMIVVTLVVT